MPEQRFSALVSAYSSVTKPHERNYITVLDALNSLKDESLYHRYSAPVLQSYADYKAGKIPKSQYQEFKKATLPSFCWQAKLSFRNNNNVEQSTGLACLDFDDVPEDSDIKITILESPYTFALFKSAGGGGFKVLVKIPYVSNDAEYKRYYNALLRLYTDASVDTGTKDIARLCFYSYDPGLYINENSDVFDSVVVEEDEESPFTDWRLMMRCVDMIRKSQPGERNTVLLKAARLAGGYVAGMQISYEDAFNILLTTANEKIPDERVQNSRTIRNGLRYGASMPIEEKQELEKDADAIFEKYGKIYYFATEAEVQKQLASIYDMDGHTRGWHSGFELLHHHYSLVLGTTTYIYGAPASGKSQWWFQLLVNQSRFHGLNHIIFSPETGGPADIFAELIAIAGGGDPHNVFGQRLSKEKYREAYEFVKKHFMVIDPQNSCSLNPTDFLLYCDFLERKFNIKFHTVTVDPWNEMDHAYSKGKDARQDLYLEEVLGHIRHDAKVNNRHTCLITHVVDQRVEYDKNTGIRYYPQPKEREIAGGQAWSRKGMNMISVWRPPVNLLDPATGFQYEQFQTVVEIQKIKPKIVGTPGRIFFKYDPSTHRYTDGRPEMTNEQLELKEDARQTIADDDFAF